MYKNTLIWYKRNTEKKSPIGGVLHHNKNPGCDKKHVHVTNVELSKLNLRASSLRLMTMTTLAMKVIAFAHSDLCDKNV